MARSAPLRARSRRCAAALVAALAALSIAGAVPADAWTEPADIVVLHEPLDGPYGYVGYSPAAMVASSPAGSVFAWTDDAGSGGYRVQARTRSPTGQLGPILDLAAGSARRCWCRCSPTAGLDASWTSPTAGFSSASTAKDVQVDADGNVVIASVTYGKQVRLQRLSAAGLPGPLVTIPTPGVRFGPIGLAVSPRGRAVVAWDNGLQEDRRLLARTASVDGFLGPVLTLSRTKHPRRALYPRAGVSDAGDAVVSWSLDSKYHDFAAHVQLRAVTVDGRIGPVRRLSRGPGESARVLVAPSGRGVVAWLRRRGKGRRDDAFVVRARLLAPDASLGQKIEISRSRCLPATSISNAGRATFAWPSARGVVARALSSTGVLGEVDILAAPGERAEGTECDSTVTLAPGDRPVAAWIHGSTVRSASER